MEIIWKHIFSCLEVKLVKIKHDYNKLKQNFKDKTKQIKLVEFFYE